MDRGAWWDPPRGSQESDTTELPNSSRQPWLLPGMLSAPPWVARLCPDAGLSSQPLCSLHEELRAPPHAALPLVNVTPQWSAPEVCTPPALLGGQLERCRHLPCEPSLPLKGSLSCVISFTSSTAPSLPFH